MTYNKLIDDISQGQIDPIYVFYGTETFLLERAIQHLQTTLLSEELLSLHHHVLDAEETSIDEALQWADMAPFLADRRMILVRRANFLTAKNNQKVSHDLDRLMAYVENPSPTAVLVFVAETDKLDERKKITKALTRSVRVVAFQPLKEAECRKFLIEEANRRGVRLSSDAVQRILQFTGGRLPLIDSELEKMIAYIGDRGQITEDDVLSVGAQSREENVFTFIDRVVRKQVGQAMDLLVDLIRQKEAPIYLLFMIARQYRIILQLKFGMKAGWSTADIASKLGIHPYAAKIASEQARLYSDVQVRRIVEHLADADYGVKSGQVGDLLAVERFILGLPSMMANNQETRERYR